MGMTNLISFEKILYKRIGYNLNVMRQSAFKVINQIKFNCTLVDWRQTLLWSRPKAIHFSWLGPELLRMLLSPPGLN